MVRQTIFVLDFVLSFVSLASHLQNAQSPGSLPLQEVAHFDQYQPTGVAVSKTGRVFVNFPLWSSHHKYSVVELMPDGSMKPYPNEQWNAWKEGDQTGSAAHAFVCVQSVWVDDDDSLWILDPASPRMEGVIPGGAKLVKVNLATNEVARVYSFEDSVAPQKSYLNDVRIDPKRKYAYMTESGIGAIITLNLQTSQAKRLLDDHPSTKAEKGVTLKVQGNDVRDASGETPQINADGIALSNDGEYLYYHALTGKTLYRIRTELLRDQSESPDALNQGVEKVAETVVTDGMSIDDAGKVYHTALEQNGITRFDPNSKKMETVVQSDRISWPDSIAFGPNRDELYFTTSQIQTMPNFNQGKDTRTDPYYVFKIKLPETRRQAAR
jgi:sugar lactone lactonase YvrE